MNNKIAVVILAAGKGSRFKSNTYKLLAQIDNKPIVRLTVEKGIAANFNPIIVVTGSQAEEIEKALKDMSITIEHNPNWENGQSTSLKAGMKAVPADAFAVCIMLADQPMVSIKTLEALKRIQLSNPDKLIAPEYHGKRGNPVLIPSAFFQELIESSSGDEGGRALFKTKEVILVPVTDPAVIRDIDTMEDYNELLKEGMNGNDKPLENE